MPHLDVVVETPIAESFRVRQVRGLFDLPPARTAREEFHVELPAADEDWSVGAIVGPSGSGKSTIAQAAYGAALHRPGEWPRDRAVIDALPDCGIKQITQMLSAVGFSSPPAWLKPYHALSTGQQFRCDLAAALLSVAPLIAFDEFTSVVDRTVAQFGSAAVANAIRARHNSKVRSAPRRKFVAVTCHYDVLPWLAADWVLDMATGKLQRGRLRRPDIHLEIRRADRAAWSGFARHHYLSSRLNPLATCYLATWRDEPVALCGVLNAIGHRGIRRISRLVVLPDYQGLGIGGRLLDAIGELHRETGFRTTITTSHPAMIARLRASPRWRITAVRRGGSSWGNFARRKNIRSTSSGRTVVSAEFRPDIINIQALHNRSVAAGRTSCSPKPPTTARRACG